MELTVKDMDIATGGTLVAILNKKDAAKLDLHTLDRIKVRKGRRVETVIVDIAESPKSVPPGRIGLFEEVLDSLNAKNTNRVSITAARKPLSLKFIRRKLEGHTLNKKEIEQIVWDIVHNKLSQIELTYFVAASYIRALDPNETYLLTKAMASQGDILKFSRYPVIDKHCIGGLPGNRTTMVLVPLVAAAGLTIPKTSSRSITSPAGTADAMEVLADVSFSARKMRKIVQKANGCIVWGGAINLAPADDKIIQVEKPLGIDAESQLLASIMAKKYSVSSTHIIIDIPIGHGAKVRDKKGALHLKKGFEALARKLHMHVRVIITDGSQPIGNGIGPALEARDVLQVLMRYEKRPMDLERKCLRMAAELFEMCNIKDPYRKAVELLESGAAYRKMQQIIKMQNGNPKILPEDIPLGKFSYTQYASKNGKVKSLNTSHVSHIARIAGAPEDKGAGLYLYKHMGDFVKKKDKLFTIYAESSSKLKYAKDTLKQLGIMDY